MSTVLDTLLHIDKLLGSIISNYGVLTYVILFCVVFGETGLVIAPFLPGDSLLFAAGTLAAQGFLNPLLLFVLFVVASILGDAVNYQIGHRFGGYLINKKPNLIKKEYIDKTNVFYDKWGGRTILVARFMPIVRTFAPFLAGVGGMPYKQFSLFNVGGGLLWVVLFLGGGYLFGNIPFVQNNFSLVTLFVIGLSILPAVYHYFAKRRVAP